jgi:hypothetical protein
MAFTPPEAIYELDFTGTELDGLTVKARGSDIGGVLALSEMIDGMGDAPDPDDAASATPEKLARYAKAMDAMRRIIDTYSRVLVSWDLEIPAGNPVPATAEGMQRLGVRHLMMIVKAWQQAVSQVSDDLGKDLPGGGPSPAGSLPMEPLSPSLAS